MTSSLEDPGQLVNSSSSSWRSWIRLDRPEDVSWEQPEIWSLMGGQFEGSQVEKDPKISNDNLTGNWEDVKFSHPMTLALGSEHQEDKENDNENDNADENEFVNDDFTGNW